jgi:hypothetical protein
MMTALNTATQTVIFTMSTGKNAVVVRQEALPANYMATSDKNVTKR